MADDTDAEHPDLEVLEALDAIDGFLLGSTPSLTRDDVAERAGVPLEDAMQLWHQLGFPHTESDDLAFVEADVEALRLTNDLVELGVINEDRQAALVRTWGRAFARLAEWQTALLTEVARERGSDDIDELIDLAAEVYPRVEALQTYAWRRHLASAASRMFAVADPSAVPLAVGFVDIVGYTAQSKELSGVELSEWVEGFEDAAAGVVVDHGGRVIKNLGDAVLFCVDAIQDGAEIALDLVARGGDGEDTFPEVRAGLAYGDVTLRLGDVFGPTVNIAARLTSVAKPSTVLVDELAATSLADAFEIKKLRRTSVTGYSKLQPYRIRPTG